MKTIITLYFHILSSTDENLLKHLSPSRCGHLKVMLVPFPTKCKYQVVQIKQYSFETNTDGPPNARIKGKQDKILNTLAIQERKLTHFLKMK